MIKKVTFLSIFLVSISANAEESNSIGLGMGISYSGLGVNISQLSENDMKYFSAGCISYSSLFGSACGVGVGWIKTDLFETESDKHGFGAYLGVVGSKRKRGTFNNDNQPAYGIGVSYHYFFNGISSSGTNLGLSFVAGDNGDETESAAILQVGYQF